MRIVSVERVCSGSNRTRSRKRLFLDVTMEEEEERVWRRNCKMVEVLRCRRMGLVGLVERMGRAAAFAVDVSMMGERTIGGR